MLSGLAGAFAACQPAPAGLIGWWPGESNGADIAGTNHGTLQGGATAGATGFVGSAFSFNGTSAFVQIADAPVLRPANFTVEAWVYPTALSNWRTVALKGAGSSLGYALYAHDNAPHAASYVNVGGNDVAATNSAPLSLSAWTHLATTYDGATLKLYVNGALAGSRSVSGTPMASSNPLCIGGNTLWGEYFAGLIDEVSLYNRALATNEIAAIYAAGGAGKCKAPVITLQPQSRTNWPGSTATFSVAATGLGALTYQWSFNGTNLVNGNGVSGSTNTTLTVSNVTAASAGMYQVVVGSATGSTPSAIAVLTVSSFSEIPAGLPNAYYGVVRWVDFDNDGFLDLFLSGYDTNYTPHTWLFRNHHDGTFAEVTTPFPNWAETDADWGDFDNDSFLDLVIKGTPGGGYSYAQVFRNLGGTNFALVTNLGAHYGGGAAIWCDFDNDGRPDILLANSVTTWVHHNNGDGTFSAVASLPGGTPSVVDYDNDGWLDIFLGGSYPLGAKRYHNTGTNAFTDSGWNFIGYYNSFSAWGDYDNDGWPDLLLSGGSDTGSGTNLLFRNDSGTLTNVQAVFAALRDGAAAWGDFDNDGHLDFFSFGLVVGCCYQSVLYRNAGSNNAFADTGLALPGVSMGSAGWGDYDNDGALDLVYMGRNSAGYLTGLYHNNGAMPDHPPTTPGGLTVTRGPNSALLSWTASTDPDQSGGLTYNLRIGSSNGAVNVLSPLADPATGFRRVPRIGNAGYRSSFLVTNLPAGTYYWSVQAIDHAFKGSPFAAEQSFNLPAPAITNQPVSQTVFAGATVTFTVGATGAAPLFYQWSFNGTNVAGATNTTLILSGVQGTNSGDYAVRVFNTFGSITSSNAVLLVNTKPLILVQPQSVSAIEGTPAGFSVTAGGDLPLSYQWLREGVPVPDATNDSLAFSAVVPAQAGGYSVQITNPSGVTNSAVATLAVPASAPVIVRQPLDRFTPPGLGVNAEFSVQVAGTTPFSYQWRFNGTNIPGATQPFLAVTNIQAIDAGAYSVLITNSVGPTLSRDAMLSVTPDAASTPHFIPGSGAVDFGYDDRRDILYIVNGGSDVQRYQVSSASFLAPFSISGSLVNVDLSPDGNLLAIADHTSGANVWLNLVDLNTSTPRQVVLTNTAGYVNSLAFGSDGAVICEVGNLVLRHDPLTGITTRRNIIFSGSGPMTASGDRSTIAIAGTGDSAGLVFTYNVTNQGIDGFIWSNDYISAPPEVNRNGSLLAEPTSFGLPIFTNQHTSDYSGDYIALIGSPSGVVFSPVQDLLFCGRGGTPELHVYETTNFTEACVLDFGTNIIVSRMRTSRDGSKIFGAVPGGINWITWTNLAPAFSYQPFSQTVLRGTNAILSALAKGSPPMRYQWQLDGVSVSGATNATLVVSNIPFPYASGVYTVTAYNPFGTVTSVGAVLTAVSAPFITSPPAPQSVGAGSNAMFTVSADGSATLTYQWRSNGTNIPGATAATLTVTNVQAANAGTYTVTIANSIGSITSDPVTLTVIPTAPFFTLQPQDMGAPVGGSVTFTAAAAGTEPIAYQWRWNGADLAGYTGTSLSLTSLQVSNSGAYSVVASNSAGATVSNPALLVVTNVPPTITTQPRGWSVPVGMPVTLSGAAGSGTPPLSYQWLLNGVPVSGATSPTLNFTALAPTDFGNYRLVVTNPGGAVTSTVAPLTMGTVAIWGYYSAAANFPLWPPPGLSNVVAVAGGPAYSLALQGDGTVVAWNNAQGSSVINPVTAFPLGGLSGIVGIAAGGSHALALRTNGTVFAWGANTAGQINVPLWLSNVVAVAAGTYHSAALRADGTVVVWGVSPRENQTNVPPGLLRVSAIDAGGSQTLALRENGTVVGWGGSAPIPVPPYLSGVTRVSVSPLGGLDLALTTNGSVVAWSTSGLATNTPPGLTNLLAVEAAGGSVELQVNTPGVSLVLRSNGTVTAWGSSLGGITNVPPGVSSVVALAGGATHALALENDGRPLIVRPPVGGTFYTGSALVIQARAVGHAPLSYRWFKDGGPVAGADGDTLRFSAAQLTDAGSYQLVVSNVLGIAQSVAVPVAVIALPPIYVSQPASGYAYYGSPWSVGASVAGSGPMHFAWRQNGVPVGGDTNELVFDRALASHGGAYQVTASNAFTAVPSALANVTFSRMAAWGNGPGLTNAPFDPGSIRDVASGAFHALAIMSNGTVKAWGTTLNGATNVPVGLSNVIAVAGGNYFSLALKSDGTVAAWGLGSSGQTTVPVGLDSVTAIAAGDGHSLALRSNGTVVAWGSSASGKTAVPAGLSNVVAIAAGSSQSLALKSDGTIFGWGFYGSIPAHTNVVAISARFDQCLALQADGTIRWWTFGKAPPPPAGLSNVVAVSAGGGWQGYSHSVVLKADGTLFAWGNNYNGQLNVPANLVSATSISAGGGSTVALLNDRSPAFTVQPWSRRIVPGTPVVLTALAVGKPALRYQWYQNGELLAGQTGSSLVFDNAQPANSGAYQAVVTNDYGAVTSAVATVDVIPPELDLFAPGLPAEGFQFSFTSLPGLIYIVEYSHNLAGGPWIELERRFGVGGLEIVVDPVVSDAMRIYRVRAVVAQSPRLNALSWSGGAMSFGFTTVSGALYVVQYKDQLSDPVWLELSRHDGTGAPIMVEDPNPPDVSRFYRIKVE